MNTFRTEKKVCIIQYRIFLPCFESLKDVNVGCESNLKVFYLVGKSRGSKTDICGWINR